MAGKTDVSYDDKQQQAVALKVTETCDTVTSSRKHTAALGSASMVILSSNAAPRSPFAFAGRAARAARALTTAASALTLAVGASPWPRPPRTRQTRSRPRSTSRTITSTRHARRAIRVRA